MPCRMDDMVERNVVAQKSAALKTMNKLTAENDLLRETLLGVLTDPDYKVPEKLLKKINVDQIKHRKEDLKRLEKTFRASKDAEKLGRVMLADPTKPLEPQLGFDHDSF